MNYIGEHTFYADLGRLFVSLAVVASLFSALAYAWNIRTGDESWKRVGRGAFRVHALAVLGVVVVLFTLLFNHWFEFNYVWHHSSTDLPLQFIASCFWEGQEGSFLLWAVWQALIGWLLTLWAKEWESGVLLTVSSVQFFLSTMLLGIYVGSLKIGSSPFVLVRELPENIGLPWVKMVDYLQALPAFAEGNGLNPLLMNGWMVIHPPTLFLGFALTVVPFAYAIAGLIRGIYSDWVKPALPWVFTGVGVLGIGVLMGGAWAYEALSFGGFWAWDPVENASLVPWITLVAAGHLMMVEKHKKSATGITLFMTLLTFWLVLYSSFLTRSGVLGDSSVHSFVDLGLSGQLLLFFGFFVVFPAFLLLVRWKQFPKNASEELLNSREFWMFIGSVTLLLSAAQITFSTSLPVINKLIGPEGWIPLLSAGLAPPIEANAHYNGLQMPFALIVSVLVAVGPYLAWRSTPPHFLKRLIPSFLLSLLLGGLIAWGLRMSHPMHIVLVATTLFATLSNLDLWLRHWRGNSRHLGMTTAHVGFVLVLLGALISQGKKEHISVNQTFIHKDFPSNENMVLEKGDTTSMYPYWVVWTGERTEGKNIHYDLTFITSEDSVFHLSPFIQINERMGNVPEPSTKHYWNKDIYTHVTYADIRAEGNTDEWQRPIEATLKSGEEAIVYDEFMLQMDTLEVHDAQFTADGAAILSLNMELHMRLKHMAGGETPLIARYSIRGDQVSFEDAIAEKEGIKVRFAAVENEEGTFKLQLWRRDDSNKPFILIQAIVFPFINVLWLGSLLMGFGSLLAVVQRLRRDKEKARRA